MKSTERNLIYKNELRKRLNEIYHSSQSGLNFKNLKKTMEGLKEATGFIRTQVAKTINLRITPELIFELDDSLEYGEKIEKILKELKNQGSGVNEE